MKAVLVVTDDPLADALCVTGMEGLWPSLVDAPLKAAGYPPVPFVTLPSAYREFLTPFLTYVRGVAAAHPDRNVAVVIPEVVERRWYDVIFASHRPAILKAVLRLRGGPRVLVVDAPWHLDDEPPES